MKEFETVTISRSEYESLVRDSERLAVLDGYIRAVTFLDDKTVKTIIGYIESEEK